MWNENIRAEVLRGKRFFYNTVRSLLKVMDNSLSKVAQMQVRSLNNLTACKTIFMYISLLT